VQLAQNVKGISKLAMILLLIIFFLLGAVFSYIWTMGFYAPQEFKLPSQTNLTIEDVQFYAENATVFDVTVLNPSYSPSDAKIERIKVSTNDGKVYLITSASPTLPLTLAPGETQTIKGFWDWGNYTGQTVEVSVIIAEGSWPSVQAETAFMNLTVTSVNFEPSVTVTRFNVTVESMRSPISVDISKIFVNGAEVVNVTPTLPYTLNPNASITFTLHRDWTDLQNKTVSVAVQTKQGYVAYKTVSAPQVKLNVSNIAFFNTTATSFYFNVTIQNSATPSAKLDINLITVHVEGQNITISGVFPSLSPPLTLEPNASVLLMCPWNWNDYQGKNVTVTVYTVQGFKASSTEITVPSIP